MMREMLQVPDGYRLSKELQRTAHSVVRTAVRESDGAPVVLKHYLSKERGETSPRAQREFEILRRVEGPSLPKALTLEPGPDSPVLVMERIPAPPLSSWLEEGPIGTDDWLEIALQLTECLVQLHDARILHRDLGPRNVLVNRETLATWLIDFGLALELGAAPTLRRGLEGTLHYVSPEQTGRLDRGCDTRSDLYSLGALLYHAATGQPPFDAKERLEMMHAHLAREPAPPAKLRPSFPETLSRVTLRLLRKQPEERYQSARSLHADLLECREQWRTRGELDPNLRLGRTEAPERPHFSATLEGREQPLARLRALAARSATGGLHGALVSGEAGAGKSSLVDALRTWIAERGSYLLAGKFDPYREQPYAAWGTALGSLTHQILLESDDRLCSWRRQLRAGLGNIARALVELVPDLEFILGDVPPVPTLGPDETRARLCLALQRFVATCATPDHPLVLFLDDLQWADEGSRTLLESVLRSSSKAALLFVGTHRTAEMSHDHPVSELLRRITQDGVALDRIELGPLTFDNVSHMLASALEREAEDVSELARLIERKTGNSPLLIRQFVEHVHARGLLRYEPGTGWCWNTHELLTAEIPEGAVALLAAKLEGLEPEARALLELASCVRDDFDLDVLCTLSSRPRGDLERALYALCDAGLIVPSPAGFRFVHDRIRETAQAGLPDEERGRLHYEMACILRARLTADGGQGADALEIVEHLNRGLGYLEPEQRLDAIALNLDAGKRAMASGAKGTAAEYFGVARGLFRTEDWTTERELGFELFRQSAHACFLQGRSREALALADVLEPHMSSRFELAQIAATRLQVHALTQAPENTAHRALQMLRQLGIRWSIAPSHLHALLALHRTRFDLRGRELRAALHPSVSLDLDRVAPYLITGQVGGILARVSVRLVALVSCFALRDFLRHGYFARPYYAAAGYAISLQTVAGASAEARRIGEAALAWAEEEDDPVWAPRTGVIIHAQLRPFLMRRRTAVEPCPQLADRLLEVGEFEQSYYARFLGLCLRALAGDPVSEVAESLHELSEGVRRAGHHYPQPIGCHDAYSPLLESEPSALDLERRVELHEPWLESHQQTTVYVRTVWMMVLCVYGRFDLAFAQSQAIGRSLFVVTPFVHVADHTFYRAICGAELASTARANPRRLYLRALRDGRRRLRSWARHGPDFAHMGLFLEAEHSRLRRQLERADRLYRDAERLARQQQFPHHAALAQERRARMLHAQDRGFEAAPILRAAASAYRQWGAIAKARSLEREG